MQRIFLSIVVLAGALLPLRAMAVTEQDADTIAGFATKVAVAESRELPTGELFTLTVFTPGGKGKVVIPWRLKESTEFIEVPGDKLTRAGKYSYQVRNKRNDTVASGTFEVFAGPVATASLEVAEEDQRDKVLLVTISDEYGNPIAGRELMLIAHDGSEAQPLDVVTRGDGTTRFLVVTDQPVASYSVVDASSNFTQAHEVAFGDLPPDRRSVPLRASLLEEFEEEEGEEAPRYGYVDHFDIRLREEQVERKIVNINKQLDFTITALDREGHRVKDYVGDVVIETTDPNALAPLQSLRFLPSHRGLLERSLALMFSTPGLHTVRVYDEDAPEIEGSLEVQVVGVERGVERGSIVLESPVSGTVISAPGVTVRGKTDAYINLDVTENGKLVTTGESGADGTFSFPLTLDLTVSTHEIVVREGEGGLGRVSKPLLLTVDANAPQLRSDSMTLLPVTVAPGRTFTVSITAEAGHTVTTSIAGAEEVPLVESSPPVEEGWSIYSGTFTSSSQPGTYPVTVAVRDPAGNTSRATKTLTVAAEGLPKVEGVQAQTLDTGVQLSWLPLAEATSYRIYFGVQPHDLSRHIDTGSTATSVRLTGFGPGQTTYFTVTALDATGRESGEKSLMVSSEPRGSLFGARLIPLLNGASMEWVPPAGADVVAYRIQYGVQPGTYTEQRLADPRSTRMQIPDLINGVTYYVSLGALLRDGKLLQDTGELSVTPGEGGRPGMHLGPADPLPEELRGMVLPREGDAIVGSVSPHPSAPRQERRPPDRSRAGPPRTPRSGLPLILGVGMLSVAAGGFVFVRFLHQWKREERLLLRMQERYQSLV